MTFNETKISGAYLIGLKPISDERGFFGRAFCQKTFEERGLVSQFVQQNLSHNKKKSTLRGLHMQVAPFEETKLVRCTRGAIFDVLVDLRPHSETYLQWFGTELSEDNYNMLYIPGGCAHGYLTLTDGADVLYGVSKFYTPQAERGFRWNDPAFAIEWPLQPEVISAKDEAQPIFQESLLQPLGAY